MAQNFAKPFYNSAAWKKCRASFIAQRRAIDGGMCQRCGRDLGFIVHHKVWLSPENIGDHGVTLNHENLEYVCHICHNKIEQGEEAPRFRFTPDGQVEGYPPFPEERAERQTTVLPDSCNIQGLCMPPSPKTERSD